MMHILFYGYCLQCVAILDGKNFPLDSPLMNLLDETTVDRYLHVLSKISEFELTHHYAHSLCTYYCMHACICTFSLYLYCMHGYVPSLCILILHACMYLPQRKTKLCPFPPQPLTSYANVDSILTLLSRGLYKVEVLYRISFNGPKLNGKNH